MGCSKRIIATAGEESSIAFGYSLTGLINEAVTPDSFTWTLTDVDGVVINSRLDQAVTPASETFVLLKGDDLKNDRTSNERILTVKAIYDSELGGVPQLNLPLTDELHFDICRELNIPAPPTP